MPLDNDHKPQPFLTSSRDMALGQFSPDGRWVLYTSDETGVLEVYVTGFPGPRGKWQISSDGGDFPRWRPDGKAIYYWSGSQLMEAEVDAKGATVEVTRVRKVLTAAVSLAYYDSPFDIGADGRILVNVFDVGEMRPLTLVTNWTANVQK
jgi:Tol biopolymer transport system component